MQPLCICEALNICSLKVSRDRTEIIHIVIRIPNFVCKFFPRYVSKSDNNHQNENINITAVGKKNIHSCSVLNATRFDLSVDEDQERLPTFYWLPKLHKQPCQARFIAHSSSCTTTELSKLLTFSLTTIKNHVIRYCEKVFERSGKIFFGQSKIYVRY